MSATKGAVAIGAAGLTSGISTVAAVAEDTQIDMNFIWKLAAELPIVLLFAFFIFKLIDRFDRIVKERENQLIQYLADEQARSRESWKRFNDGLIDNARAVDQLSVILLYHDATCRGMDPKAFPSQDDLLRILKGKQAT